MKLNYLLNKKLGFIPLETTGQPKDRKMSLSGFTLAEIMLATAILSFGLVSLLAFFISCALLNEANRNLTIATGHAQFVLEEIKNTNFSNIQTMITSGDWDWDSSAITAKGLNALVNESTDTQVIGVGTDPLDVEVSVKWKDRVGRNREVKLETLWTEQ